MYLIIGVYNTKTEPLFSLEDACGFIAETASFYIAVESSGSMHVHGKYYGNHLKYLYGIAYVESFRY